jgi:hypothetical protein
MKKTIKKIIASLLIGLILAPIFSSTVKADDVSPWYDPGFKEWFIKVYDTSNPTEIFGERYTAAQVKWILYSIMALPFSGARELSIAAFTGDAAEAAKAVKKLLSEAKSTQYFALKDNKEDKNFASFMLEERPLSGISYLKKGLKKISIIPEAKAQTDGYGYQAMGILQPWWKNVRDASFTLLVLVTVITAFLIMFRVKISPQAVVTIQSFLPKLIITIILITFSYAIAGFLVDLMYLVYALAIKLIFPNRSFYFMWAIFNGNGGGIFLIFLMYVFFFVISALLGFMFWMTNSILNTLAGTISFPIFVLLIIIVALLLMLLLIFNIFKITWMLLKTTAQLFIAIIFSPLKIMASLLTNQSPLGFVKDIASNLIIFPIVGILMFLALEFEFLSVMTSLKGIVEDNFILDILNLIAELFGHGRIITNFILPGEIWNPPFFDKGLIGFVLLGVSFVIITIIPKTADIIKGMIEGKPFAYGTAIGEAVKTPIALGQGALAAKITKTEETAGPSPLGSFLRTIGLIRK